MKVSKFLKLLATALTLAQVVMTIFILTGPATITTHWGLAGNPDGSGSKFGSIVLCVLNTCVYALFWVIDRHPQWCNYPKKFANREIAKVYLLKMLWIIGIWFAFAPAVYFTYMMYSGSHFEHWVVPMLFICGIIGVARCIKQLNRIE